MWLRFAAIAVFAIASCLPAWAQSPGTLTLDDAFTRVAKTHPDLRLVDSQRGLLSAEFDRASLRPAYVAGMSIENALGSGSARGFDEAEISLTLASVLERGGKLDARRTLAQARIDALALQRETKRLDLLAEVARRYLEITAAQQQEQIAMLDIRQRQRTVAGAKHRFSAGASPEFVVLTAQAALARAEMERERALQRLASARQHLAALWGEREPVFQVVAGDPLVLPDIAEFSALVDLLQATPELARFADEQRIAEARLQLARSQNIADLDWQVGVRRLQVTDDFALIGSISMPLGSARRNQPELRAADAELAIIDLQRESQGLALYSTLADAHGRYRVAQVEAARLQSDVLPKLGKAETAAENAYRAGAISYLEWAQLQSERTSARKQQLDAALEAQRALIEIQRLTGQAFVADPASSATQGNQP